MTAQQSVQATKARPSLGPAGRKRMVTVIVWSVVMNVILLLAAGRFDWTRGWVYIGAGWLTWLVNAFYILRRNPEIVVARGTKHENTKRFDKVFKLLSTPVYLGIPVLAGLDAARFEWSSLPMATLWVGLVLLCLGQVPVTWAMVTNPHLETTVRIQADRGHKVVTAGPYGYVRHPMYVGVILQLVAMPLVVGSAWALVLTGVMVLLLVVRTALEDRTLRAELEGYADYARRVRYRLIPGVF